MKFLTAIFILGFLFASCKKDGAATDEARYDWQIVDALGNKMMVIRDKTETGLIDFVKSGAAGCFNGNCSGYVLNRCEYFKIGDPVFCWKDGTHYMTGMSEKQVSCYSPAAQKISDCVISEFWYTRKKMVYNPAGTITYSPVTYKSYTNIDTVNLFNTTQQIVLLNTADSFNTLQRSKTASNFY